MTRTERFENYTPFSQNNKTDSPSITKPIMTLKPEF